MEYKVNLMYDFVQFSSWKEKPYLIMVNNLTNGQYAQMFKYRCPGLIDFCEYSKDEIVITELTEFKRKKVNAIIFDMKESWKNPGYFDTMIVYMDETGKSTSYGFIFYNTETNNNTQKYFIYGDVNDLFRSLNDSLNCLQYKDLFDFFEAKIQALKNKENEELFTEIKYQEIINTIKNR